MSEGIVITEGIIIAVITGLLSVVGAYISNSIIARKKSREDAIKETEREARQAIKIETIEKKLDIHNKYAEKFGDIQKDIAVIKNEVANLKNRSK